MAAKCKVIVFELMVFQTSQSWLILLPDLDIWKLRWGHIFNWHVCKVR